MIDFSKSSLLLKKEKDWKLWLKYSNYTRVCLQRILLVSLGDDCRWFKVCWTLFIVDRVSCIGCLDEVEEDWCDSERSGKIPGRSSEILTRIKNCCNKASVWAASWK